MPFSMKILEDTVAFFIGKNELFKAIGYIERAGTPVAWRAPSYVGECVFDTVGKVFYYGTDTTTANGWSAGSGGGGGLSDGSYGDVTVGGTGTTMAINAGAVDLAMLSTEFTTAGKALLDDVDNAAQRTTLGLGTAATQATGAFDAAGAAAAAQAAAIATASSDATSKANAAQAAAVQRGNHTGTQNAVTIGDSTTAGRALLTAANEAAQRTALELGTAAQSATGDFAPIAHVGAGGAEHANAVSDGAAGFMTGTDKLKLDGIAAGATVGGGLSGLRLVTGTGNITSADANGVVILSGSGYTVTFVRTSFVANQAVKLIKIGTGTITISAGTDGFNTAANDSFTLFEGDNVDVIYEGSGDPYWRTNIAPTLTLAANQYARLNSAGTAMEAVDDKVEWGGAVMCPAAGTASIALFPSPNFPVTWASVWLYAPEDMTAQITKDGSGIQGTYGSATSLTANTGLQHTTTETSTVNARFAIVPGSVGADALVYVRMSGIRTGA